MLPSENGRMEINYYLKKEMYQLEVTQACPGCGKLDQLSMRQKVVSYMHDRTEYYIGCNCGWCGPVADNPIEAATKWEMRFLYVEW